MNIEDFAPVDVEWCEICRKHKAGCCDGCEARFTPMIPAYRSTSHHFHPGSINGVSGTHAIHKMLCVDCYRVDFSATYHTEPPPLPDKGMDPAWFAARQEESRIQTLLDKLARLASGEGTPDDRQDLEKFVIGSRPR